MSCSKFSSNRGMALGIVLLFMMVALVSFASLSRMTVGASTGAQIQISNNKAFYLAEAAVADAISRVQNNFLTMPVANDGEVFALGEGQYRFSVVEGNTENDRVITGEGTIPSFDAPITEKKVEVTVESVALTLPNVFENAIYATDLIDINGASHTIDGDIFAGDSIACSPGTCPGVTGTKTEEGDDDYPQISIDFEGLKKASQQQGYYFSGTPSASDLPADFYETAPTADHPGVPRIVFIEGDLVVSGNDAVGGFLVVAGNILSGGDGTEAEATVSGKCTIDGVILVAGDYVKNGGGPAAVINGAIVAMGEARMNGKSTVTYNQDYADALGALEIHGINLQMESWNETEPDTAL